MRAKRKPWRSQTDSYTPPGREAQEDCVRCWGGREFARARRWTRLHVDYYYGIACGKITFKACLWRHSSGLRKP